MSPSPSLLVWKKRTNTIDGRNRDYFVVPLDHPIHSKEGGEATQIKKWYDRRVHRWVVSLATADDSQIGPVEYCSGPQDAAFFAAFLMESARGRA